MLHASSDAIEGQYKRLSSPEAEKWAKESEMEDEIANIGQMLLLIMFLERLC